jgi:uncharacterized protein YecE (DUF72 family)
LRLIGLDLHLELTESHPVPGSAGHRHHVIIELPPRRAAPVFQHQPPPRRVQLGDGSNLRAAHYPLQDVQCFGGDDVSLARPGQLAALQGRPVVAFGQLQRPENFVSRSRKLVFDVTPKLVPTPKMWVTMTRGRRGGRMTGGAPAAGSSRVGCSGWMYRHWRGSVYPASLPSRRWFEHYATLFDTVEINNTFYRLPTEAAVEGWAAQAPPGFVYSLKLGSFGSHRMKLGDAESWLPNHLDRVERLGPSAGPTLVQLPPRWRRNAARLDEFLSVAGSTRRWAVELRESSWLHDEVYEVLRAHGAALCIHDLLVDHPWELTADWTYLRFHGPDAVHHAYQGRYGPDRLAPVADRLTAWLDQAIDVYAYFNNDDSGFAVQDAQWLAQRLGSERWQA